MALLFGELSRILVLRNYSIWALFLVEGLPVPANKKSLFPSYLVVRFIHKSQKPNAECKKIYSKQSKNKIWPEGCPLATTVGALSWTPLLIGRTTISGPKTPLSGQSLFNNGLHNYQNPLCDSS